MEIQKASLVGIQRASHSNHPTTQNVGQTIAAKMSVVCVLVLHIADDTDTFCRLYFQLLPSSPQDRPLVKSTNVLFWTIH